MKRMQLPFRAMTRVQIAVLLALVLAVTLLPNPAFADCVAIGTQCIKNTDGPAPTQTLDTVQVTGTYIPGPTFDVSSIASFYNGGRTYFRGDAFSYNSHTASTVKPKNKGNCLDAAADPVVVSDGAKVLSIPLFALPGEMGLNFTLYYHSETGSGADNYEPWLSSIDYLLDTDCGFTNPNIACSQVTLYRPDGSSLSFSGNHASYGNFPEIGGGGLATLVHNADGTWTLHDEDTSVQTYNSAGQLTSIKDVSGVGWTISSTVTTDATPDTVHPCTVPAGQVHAMCTGPNPPPVGSVTTITTLVTHTDGQSYSIVSKTSYNTTWASQNVTVTDPAGNQYTYEETGSQGASGLWIFGLTSLTLPGTPVTTISFAGGATLLTGVSYNGAAYWTTSYNSNNEVSNDGAADGTERTSIVYATGSGSMVATITNPLGLTTKNTYTTDAQGNYLLASVSNSAVQGCGATTNSLAWDGNDNLKQTVDNDGVIHTYSYAANGQLQTETEASGTSVARKTDYVWDPNAQLNRISSVTVEGESKTSYAYNAQNRIASVTLTNLTNIGTANQSLTTSYAYTLYGNGMVEAMTVTQPSPSGSDHTTYAYDTHGNLTSVTDGLGHATTYSGYNALGEVGKIVGPNGDETDYTYDARGRVASKTTHPNGTTATWTYTYDGFGLLAQVSAPDGEVTTWTRDAEKRVKTITHNDKDGTSTETFGYDANGDVTSDVVARGGDIGKSTSYVYNALGKVYQVKGTHGQVLTYGYDGNGNVLSVTDALGHRTGYAYDALNRLIGVTDAASGITSYTYDAGDHVIGLEDPRGLVTSYEWDGLGLLWQQVSPDTGTDNFTYDGYGRLIDTAYPSGSHTTYGYDAINRLVSRDAGGASQTFTYDNCTHGLGRLCSAADSTDTTAYSYTPEGWIAEREFSFANGPTYDIAYSHNEQGQVTVVVYPDNNEAVYDYVDGVVADVRLRVGSYNVTGVSNIAYRPMDLAMSTWTSYNGLTNTIAYDSDLRPTSIIVPGVESLAFRYDAANRLNGITNGMDSTQSETLGYDTVNRLNSVASTAENESYEYDADGNRTSQVINGVATTYTVSSNSNELEDALNHSTGLTTSYGYDTQGDLTTWQTYSGTPPPNPPQLFYYTGFNRWWGSDVNGVFTWQDISPEGQRLRKYTADTKTYFAPDASGPLLAEDQNGDWMDYVWLNGRVVTVISNGGVFPLHDDQTGRPLYMTDPSSHTIDWAAQGLPFDRNVTTNHWGGFNIGFPGQYFDEEDGLWNNGARDYDASLGRYIESDPIGLAGGVNTYAYVEDNPISNVDPLGLCPTCTQLQQQAAQLAAAFKTVSEQTGAVAFGGALATGLAAFFEPETFGADTPATIAAADATGYAGGVSIIAAAASADLNSFASGNLRAIGSFDFSSLAEISMKLTASRLPVISNFSDTLGQLSGKTMEIAIDVPIACKSQ